MSTRDHAGTRRPRLFRRGWAGALGIAFAATMLVLPAAASANGAYEPNDSASTATGPLQSGAWYSAVTETENDEDWYFLYTTGTTQLDISVTGMGRDNCLGTDLELMNGDGDAIETTYPAEDNETEHILYTARAAATYYLKVQDYHIAGCFGPDAYYSVKVDSSIALGTTPPPVPAPPSSVPSSGSGAADRLCSSARQRVSRLQRQLRGARSARRRAAVRRQLRSARSQATSAC